jgi:multisubunit Na+/H+ antiporter MnhF subunit
LVALDRLPEVPSHRAPARVRPVNRPLLGVASLFALLFITVNLHILRNLWPLFVAVPAVLYVLLAIAGLMRGTRVRPSLLFVLAASFVGYSLLIIPYSLLWATPREVAYGAARLLFALPLVLFSAAFLKSAVDLARIFRIYCVLVALGGASILLQIATGPISWFAEPSLRGGLDRYASLLGSLTVMGVAGGLALSVMPWAGFRRRTSWLLAAMIVFGMVASLQKAAVVTLAVWPFAYAVARRIPLRKVLTLTARVIGAAVLLALLTFLLLPRYFNIALALFGYRAAAAGTFVGRHTIAQGVAARSLQYPMRLFDQYGEWGVVFGVGMKAGSGVFGIQAPMAHNSLADLLFMGGVMYLLLFGLVVVVMLVVAYRVARGPDPVSRGAGQATLCFMVVLLMNLPFSSGRLFQPTSASIFWCLVGHLSQLSIAHRKQGGLQLEQ